MQIDMFEGCCSANIVYAFGDGHEDAEEECYTKQAIIDYLKKELTHLKKSCAVVFACVTTTQPNAIAALQELGFYGYTDKGAEGRSKGHNMFPFFMPLMEWNLKAFNERYDPKQDKYVNKPSEFKGMKYSKRNDRFW